MTELTSSTCEFSLANSAKTYANGSIIGDVITFQNVSNPSPAAPSGKSLLGSGVTIRKVRLEIDRSSLPDGMTSFDLQVYSSPMDDVFTDGDLYFDDPADAGIHLGNITGLAPYLDGTKLVAELGWLGLSAWVVGSSLYAYLISNGAYEALAGETYRVTLWSEPAE